MLGLVFLAIAFGYLAVMLVKWSNAPAWHGRDLAPLLFYALVLAAVHGAFLLLRFRGDRILPAVGLFLAGMGLLAQFRLGTLDYTDPARIYNYAFPGGVVLMVVLTALLRRGRYQALESLAWPALALALVLLGFILLAGQRYRGAVFLPGRINPSDALKVLLMLFAAAYLAWMRGPAPRGACSAWRQAGAWWPFAVAWALPMGLLVLQRDLGMVVLLNATLITMWYFSGRRLGGLLLGLLVLAALGYLVVRFSAHSQQRIAVWQDPFRDPTGSGWQILQGLAAMNTGGWWGTGFGVGSPHNIPIASSDFVYAVIGEEAGFIGCGLVLLFYVLMIYRGYRIAFHLRDPFSHLLGAGLISGLALQTLINIGGVTKFIPLTGVTLPFISHGGSSLVTTLATLGIVLAMSEPSARGERGKRAAPR